MNKWYCNRCKKYVQKGRCECLTSPSPWVLISNNKEWKLCAKKLYKALKRTNFSCNQLDHSGGHRHGDIEDCPIIEMIYEALKDYEKLSKKDNNHG